MSTLDQLMDASASDRGGNEVVCSECNAEVDGKQDRCTLCGADLLGFASSEDRAFDETADRSLVF